MPKPATPAARRPPKTNAAPSKAYGENEKPIPNALVTIRSNSGTLDFPLTNESGATKLRLSEPDVLELRLNDEIVAQWRGVVRTLFPYSAANGISVRILGVREQHMAMRQTAAEL